MAEAFLEEIYQYAKVITAFRQVVDYLRVEDTHHANFLLEKYEKQIRYACADCAESGYQEARNLWELVCHVYQDEKDNIVRGDMIENAIVPILEKWVQSLGNITQQVDEEWQLESTACGFLTLKNLHKDRYLHSNNNPMEEARKQIECFYVPSVESYAILGCGLGYQAYQLYCVSNGSVKIRLYEQDARVIEYARKYGVLDWIPQDVIEVCMGDSVFSFLKDVDSNEVGAFMHRPSLSLLKNEVERNAMIQAYGEQHTPDIHKRDNQINFWRNIHSDAELIGNLPLNAVKDEVAVVAAGPSLDDCIETLRGWQGKKTIIAVGTVFAKLLKLGIRPDFVTIMDPQQRTLKQLEGLEEEDIPMILDAVAYWEFARRYKGKKYLVLTPQNQEALQYAEKNGIALWPSGGTVMSLAVEVAIRFHAKAVYLVGVDLAYPDGISHASDTMDRKVKTLDGMQQICGVMGQTVYATHIFCTYRRWLEAHISHYPQITWYNLSTKGAKIAGTIEIGEQVLNGTF